METSHGTPTATACAYAKIGAHTAQSSPFGGIDCTVRNLSPTGACLNVASVVGIPEQFDVFFEADRSIRACRLVWHKEKQVGIEFAEETADVLPASA